MISSMSYNIVDDRLIQKQYKSYDLTECTQFGCLGNNYFAKYYCTVALTEVKIGQGPLLSIFLNIQMNYINALS